MRIILAILIGILFAIPTQAIRFDWVLGQPTEVLNGETTGTTSDSIWWVLGQPTPMASSTVTGEAPPAPPPTGRNSIIIISENNIKLKIG